MTATSATASAPASIGNCAAGFDVLGHSFAGPVDRVTCTRRDHDRVEVAAIRGTDAALPRDAERNTAGRASTALKKTSNRLHVLNTAASAITLPSPTISPLTWDHSASGTANFSRTSTSAW